MAEEAKSGSRTPSHDGDDWIPNGDREEPRYGDRSEPENGHRNEPKSGDRAKRSNGGREEQKITAPSLGPNTVIEREPVEERLAKHDQSEVDAMGRDKRRPVIGQSYGPSKARQLGLYGIFLAVVAALVIGGIVLVGKLDTPVGKHVPNSAPWSKPGVKQIKPKPIQ